MLVRLGIIGALALAARKGFLNSRDLQLIEIDIGLENLPASFDGLRIGHMTDIHAGPLVPRELIREGVDLVMGARPDLIVLTGDFMNGNRGILRPNNGSFKQHHYDYCIEELQRLNAPFGVFGVMGNHDFWSGKKLAEAIVEDLGSIGIRMLRNESVVLENGGDRLYLLGVDDYWQDSYDLKRATRSVPREGCRILLSHNPDVNEDITRMQEHIDLVVSGHTHGGQIVLPVLGFPYLLSPFGQKYRAGLVRDHRRQTYISCGLGAYLAPIRLNCPPDVSVLTLYRQAADA
jgi:predicted MPP superfamily phosphohydrolase